MNPIEIEEINREFKTFTDFKYIHCSRFRNGFLKQWIENYLIRKNSRQSMTNYETILSLIFMSLIVIRILKVINIESPDDRILVYLGSPWYYLGGHHSYNETVILLWTINYIAFYIIDMTSHRKQYKWLQIFAFLSGIISHQKIGKYMGKLTNLS
jgi:hypothetical protein